MDQKASENVGWDMETHIIRELENYGFPTTYDDEDYLEQRVVGREKSPLES